jgi:hypothetical protein
MTAGSISRSSDALGAGADGFMLGDSHARETALRKYRRTHIRGKPAGEGAAGKIAAGLGNCARFLTFQTRCAALRPAISTKLIQDRRGEC